MSGKESLGDSGCAGPGAREPSPQDAVSALRASPPVALVEQMARAMCCPNGCQSAGKPYDPICGLVSICQAPTFETDAAVALPVALAAAVKVAEDYRAQEVEARTRSVAQRGLGIQYHDHRVTAAEAIIAGIRKLGTDARGGEAGTGETASAGSTPKARSPDGEAGSPNPTSEDRETAPRRAGA